MRTKYGLLPFLAGMSIFVRSATFKLDVFDDLRQFTIPFEKFRNLRALTLETDNWSPKLNLNNAIIPPLRSLRLCIHSRWTWLGYDKMRDQGTSTDFQDLSINVYGSPIAEWAKEISKFPNIVAWLRSPIRNSTFI